jgi:pre-rRNA-processing protein RIX1
LTKIFLLTHEYPTLIREITTPSLPTFITKCIQSVTIAPKYQAVDLESSLLPLVLDAFCQLMPNHPTLFRHPAKLVEPILYQLMAPTPSSFLESTKFTVSQQVRDLAQQLFILQHYHHPKNASGEEWSARFRRSVLLTHWTCDQVFRAVIEDWETVQALSIPESEGEGPTYAEEVSSYPNDQGFPEWKGIIGGMERLIGHLQLLKQHFVLQTASPVNIPLGLLVNLLTRIFSITVPTGAGKNDEGSLRPNLEIGRDERDGLWAGLPKAHVAAIEVLIVVVENVGEAFVPLAQGVLEQLRWVFRAEKRDP